MPNNYYNLLFITILKPTLTYPPYKKFLCVYCYTRRRGIYYYVCMYERGNKISIPSPSVYFFYGIYIFINTSCKIQKNDIS